MTNSAACYIKLTIIDNIIFDYKDYTPIRCLVISLTLACTVIVAKLVSSILPLIAKKLRLNPALVASPFITTIVDILSLIIYCTLAINILT